VRKSGRLLQEVVVRKNETCTASVRRDSVKIFRHACRVVYTSYKAPRISLSVYIKATHPLQMSSEVRIIVFVSSYQLVRATVLLLTSTPCWFYQSSVE
jgi:hypothetical protein